MNSRHVFSALSGVLLAASVASATIETRTVSITNNTANHWSKVMFYFNGPVLGAGTPFFAIEFVEDLSLHSASQNPVATFIADPGTNDILVFDYSTFAMLAPGGTYEFTLTVSNPFDAEFTILTRTFAGPPQVPAPAAGLLLAAPLAVASRRRR